jgi:hypothetical protein
MNSKSLAKKECANYWNNRCLSITITPDLQQYIDDELPQDKCTVDKESCKYFEDIIIRQIRGSRNSSKQAEEAIVKYEEQLRVSTKLRKCRECHKSFPSSFHNEKYCSDCKKKRKLKSNREYKKRARSRKST